MRPPHRSLIYPNNEGRLITSAAPPRSAGPLHGGLALAENVCALQRSHWDSLLCCPLCYILRANGGRSGALAQPVQTEIGFRIPSVALQAPYVHVVAHPEAAGPTLGAGP